MLEENRPMTIHRTIIVFYIELETEDGRPMQIRVVGFSTCIVEGMGK